MYKLGINTNDVPVRDDIKATGELNWMDFMDVGKSKQNIDFDKVKEKIVDILPGIKQHNTVNEYEWFTKGTNEYDSTIMVWLPNTMLNDMHINSLKEEFGAKFVCIEADSLHNGDDCLHLIIHNISNIKYYK
jgi:hypothetical protein